MAIIELSKGASAILDRLREALQAEYQRLVELEAAMEETDA